MYVNHVTTCLAHRRHVVSGGAITPSCHESVLLTYCALGPALAAEASPKVNEAPL